MIDPQSLCDVEAERAVLGAALVDSSAADVCLPLLPTQAMGREAHRRAWSAIRRLRGRGSPCDTLTVADELQVAGDLDLVGGTTFLADLVAEVATTVNAADYAALVRDAWARREAQRCARYAMAMAADVTAPLADVRAALASAVRAMAEAEAAGRAGQTLDALALEAWAWVESLYDNRDQPGLSTGIPSVDAWLGGGLHRGELTILGGRPSAGKSALAQQVAQHVASAGGRVLFASAEMDGRTVGLRSLSLVSGVDGRRLRGAPPLEERDWPLLGDAIGQLGRWGQNIAVTHPQTIDAVSAECRRLNAQSPLTLVVVDHLQHLRSPRGTENRNQAIGQMAAECKALAVTLGIAVLALSQLNRSAADQDRRPRMHDLRESGELEQLADTVLLLHRKADEKPPPVCDVELIVAKQRNGEVGALRLVHHRPSGRFRAASA